MITKFQILFNRTRQAVITGELVEIITGGKISKYLMSKDTIDNRHSGGQRRRLDYTKLQTNWRVYITLKQLAHICGENETKSKIPLLSNVWIESREEWIVITQRPKIVWSPSMLNKFQFLA